MSVKRESTVLEGEHFTEVSVKNDNYGQFRCWLLHFSFAKNKFYFTYPLAHAQKVNQFSTFSETKPKNTLIQGHGFLWCCSWRIESNVSLNPWISVLNFVSTEFQFFYVVFFLWERFQWFCRLIIDCIKSILFSRFDDHNNLICLHKTALGILPRSLDWNCDAFLVELFDFLLFFQYFVCQRFYHGPDLFFWVRR